MSFPNHPVVLPGNVTPVDLPQFSRTTYTLLEERILSDGDTRVTSDGSVRVVNDMRVRVALVVLELPGNVTPVEVD